MAPVDVSQPPSLLPAFIVFSRIFLTGYLSAVVGRIIYRSYLALPPSAATRHRASLRRGHVEIFLMFAFTSLIVSAYYGISYSSSSYRDWASTRGVELPNGLFGDKGALRGGEHPGRLHVVRWLNDTPFYRGSLEILAEKPRYFWWSQQIDLGTLPWSMFLAIEGRRRRIPRLWTFFALAQLVNLSYAQNLFYVAVLLTPVPLPTDVQNLTRSPAPISSSRFTQLKDTIIPTRPEGWLPNPIFNLLIVVATYGTVLLLPAASNTSSFVTITFLSKALPLLPLLLPYIISEKWGTAYTDPHAAYSDYTTLFRLTGFLASVLHFKSTIFTVFNTDPDVYYRYGLLNVPHREEHVFRGPKSIGQAIAEHNPIIRAVGWDVIASGLALGVWASIRGLDLISGPLLTQEHVTQEKDAKPSTDRRPGRPKKSHDEDANDASYVPNDNEHIEEGDEDAEEEWEAGASAWGIISLGGLGLGGASVFGTDVVAR